MPLELPMRGGWLPHPSFTMCFWTVGSEEHMLACGVCGMVKAEDYRKRLAECGQLSQTGGWNLTRLLRGVVPGHSRTAVDANHQAARDGHQRRKVPPKVSMLGHRP